MTPPESSAKILHSSAPTSTYVEAVASIAEHVPTPLVAAQSPYESEVATLGGVRHGRYAGAIVTTTALAELDPRFGIADLPYFFRSRHDRTTFWEAGGGKVLLDSLPGLGLHCLAVLDGGHRHFFTRQHPIRTPGDLAERRLRVLPSQPYARWLTDLGAVPVQVAPARFRRAMRVGDIDGAERSLSNIIEYEMADLARHVCLSGHQYCTALLVVSTGWLDSLGTTTSAKLKSFGQNVSRQQSEAYAGREAYAHEALRIAGTEFIDPDVSAFRRSAHGVYEWFSRVVPAAAPMIPPSALIA